MAARWHSLSSRLFLLFLLALQPWGLAYPQANNESQLKAAYLVNFLKYVDWPEATPTATICLFGRDTLGGYLAPYETRSIAGRELRIRRVSGPDHMGDCQLLFIPESEEARYGAVLRWVERLSVLTVSDAEIFTRQGGAIALVRTEGRLQFDINVAAVSAAGLKPSSQLMRLARVVVGATK